MQTLNEDRARVGVGNILDEGELFLAQGVLVNQTSTSENISGQVINSIHWGSATSELKAV